MGLAGAKEKVAQLENKLKEKYGVSLTWKGDSAQVKGTGVTGQLTVGDKTIALELKLGLLLKPMRSNIQQAMEHHIDKALA